MINIIDLKNHHQFVAISKKYKDLFEGTLQVAPSFDKILLKSLALLILIRG